MLKIDMNKFTSTLGLVLGIQLLGMTRPGGAGSYHWRFIMRRAKKMLKMVVHEASLLKAQDPEAT